ncbi:alpha/beta hydrolase [Cupriavidus basilensis]|uniref:Alpha/beta hydrolase n=1 Tax=Cupriavidus basilensis TaxID=68895 RepID=A0ABT6ATV6_9BURK|nr:alpha/beta hydrolase [Cupriavidus basilensis]MDF3836061.1 alpha/beta hydrolase [Cupriavidus basilensis]
MTEAKTDTRTAPGSYNAKGEPQHAWNLSPSDRTDAVQCPLPPEAVLPVIFVPGIMGTNLMTVPDAENGDGLPVWRLDAGSFNKNFWLFRRWNGVAAGERQQILHPDRVTIDDGGAVPKRQAGSVRPTSGSDEQGQQAQLAELYRARGWGEVSETSYHDFLLHLEATLNNDFLPHRWPQFHVEPDQLETLDASSPPRLKPGAPIRMPALQDLVESEGLPTMLSDDLLARSLYRMPIHACGYNWLASNKDAAERLAERIAQVIQQYGDACKQVILVTHSMGGLVARQCARLPGMSECIAGIVHGVMPANGAPVAYRRCKLGMREESFMASKVIGPTGREISAVFAQAPGALQLLPTTQYRPGWLRLFDEQGKPIMPTWPAMDPYEEIYLRRDRWWGLMREEWLSPENGAPITWQTFADNITAAKDFHRDLGLFYHTSTYAYYGADARQPSFDSITWDMKRPRYPQESQGSLTGSDFSDMETDAVIGGSNPVLLKLPERAGTQHPGDRRPPAAAHWKLRCRMQDGIGDGTVPEASGRAPQQQAQSSQVRYQFRLTGFDHEKSYLNARAQAVTLYSVIKIAAQATKPACIQ